MMQDQSRIRFLSYLLFILLVSAPTINKAQVQLTDVVTLDGDFGSSPSNFVEYNSLLFFRAYTVDLGGEIWVSDGTPENHYLLKDINHGPDFGIITDLTEASVILNDKLFFVAQDNSNGVQIWSTDGTPENTIQVTNLIDANIRQLTLVGNEIFFLMYSNEFLQVWKTDGTDTGTVIVKDAIPIGNNPSFQGEANDLFFFTFQPVGSNDSRVWRSDGTESGTYPITPEIDGNGAGMHGNPSLTQYIEFNDELYFVFRGDSSYFPGSNTVGIMKTDGSLANTVPVTGLFSYSRVVDFADVLEVNGKLYFSFFTPDNGTLDIWESDGTQAGTFRIYFENSTKYFMPSFLQSNGQNLLFTGPNAEGNTSLISLNLTSFNHVILKELNNEIEEPFIFEKSEHVCFINLIGENSFFLSIPNNNYTYDGWVSDGTAQNTIKNSQLDQVRETRLFDDNFYFAAQTENNGKELWRGNENATQLELFANIYSSKYGLQFDRSALINDKLVFSLNYYIHGQELWVYDDSTEEAKLLKNIDSEESYSNPRNFTPLNDKIIFVVNSGGNQQIWETDGTEEGTIVLLDSIQEEPIKSPRYFVNHNDKLYFFTIINGNYNLIEFDGLEVQVIKDLGSNEFNFAFRPRILVSSENYLYFSVYTAPGHDLWRSDGTEAGTIKIKDLYDMQELTAVGEKVFFSGTEVQFGQTELWYSDGSAANTNVVKDLEIGSSADPKDLVAFGNTLVFTANTSEFGRELWSSDGTNQGTSIIRDFREGILGSGSRKVNYAVYNDQLFFTANDGLAGVELWKTNGTFDETQLVADINPGNSGSFPSNIITSEGGIYFSARTETNGSELWFSDGTTENTKIVYDILAGAQSSWPSNLNIMNDTLVFIAETQNSGKQFWKLSNDTNIAFDNFKILITDETCRNKDNGMIKISADQQLEYILTITGMGLNQTDTFTEMITFQNLPSGNYDICIKVTGDSDYEFCSTATISEPDELDVSSKISISEKLLSLQLEGAASYWVFVNDNTYETSDNEISIPLLEGKNSIKVTTNKECQGIYEEIVFLEEGLTVFPNPINGPTMNIIVPNYDLTSTEKIITIYTLAGREVQKKVMNFAQQSLDLDVSKLAKGVFLLQVKTDHHIYVAKVVKN